MEGCKERGGNGKREWRKGIEEGKSRAGMEGGNEGRG